MTDEGNLQTKYDEAIRVYAVGVIGKAEALMKKLGDDLGKHTDLIAKTHKKHKKLLAKVDRRIERAVKAPSDA